MSTMTLSRRAAIAAGPLFLASVTVNSWANIDFLHGLGWRLVGGADVPWPSVLALAPHGWIQIATFAVTGALLLVFADGLRAMLPRTRPARVAGWATTAFAVAFAASAAPTDWATARGADPDTWYGRVHGLAFLAMLASVLLAMVLLGIGVRRIPNWRPLALASPLAAVALIVALIFGPHGQAAFVVTLVVIFGWVAALGSRLVGRAEARTGQHESAVA